MRSIIDWNSKKAGQFARSVLRFDKPTRVSDLLWRLFADDDDIETDIRVRYLDIVGPPPELSVPELPTEPLNPGGEDMQVDTPSHAGHAEHGVRADGEPAFCRRTTEGLVDCPACLDEAEALLLRELNQEERSVAGKILTVLREAGPAGLTKQTLLVRLPPRISDESAAANLMEHRST